MHPRTLDRRQAARTCGNTLGLALVAALGLLTALPATAQLINPKPKVFEDFSRTDRNVAVRELSRNLPSTGVRKVSKRVGFLKWQTTQTLSLFGVTKRGFASRSWDSDNRSWTDWQHLGNPTGAPMERISGSGDSPGLDFHLPLLHGWGLGYPDWIAYQGFGRPTGQAYPDFATGIMQVDTRTARLDYGESNPPITTVTTNALPLDFDHFDPEAGLRSVHPMGTNRFTRHMFGTGVPRGYVKSANYIGADIPVIELRQEIGQNPVWIDRGTPPGHTGVAIGPGSAVSVIHDLVGGELDAYRDELQYVFVSTDPTEDGYGDGLNGSEIAYLEGTGYAMPLNGGGAIPPYSWNSLGSPGELVYGAPLAVKTYTNIPIAGGIGRIAVFATVTDGPGNYRLAQRFHDGSGWNGGWTSLGAPAGLSGGKFKLTSSVVWYEGQANKVQNLRVSAFGYSEELNSRKGQLVELRFDGNSWSWQPLRSAPDGGSFRTATSSVIDEYERDRIVVIGRTEGGRIYEFSREITNGRAVEGWKDLSYEPLVVRRTTGSGFGSLNLGN